MANLTAYSTFDINRIDFNILIRNQTDILLQDNIYSSYNGITYEDVLEIEYYAQGYVYAVFGGTGFTATPTGIPTGGTVTGFLEAVHAGGGLLAPLYALENFSARAVDIYGAVSTRSNTDDLRIVSNAMSGSDKVVMSSGNDVVRGFSGNDKIYGNEGMDVLVGDAGADLIAGGAGDDGVVGGGGNDRLLGQAGNDEMGGDSGSDEMLGGGGNDRMFGGGGKDELKGGGGNDLLVGDGGADKLFGQAGKDILIGGKANDILAGGGGTDLFVFARNGGRDTIRDFNANREHIEITSGASRYAQLTIRQNGDDAKVKFGQTVITLLDVDADSLTKDVFDFT